MTTDIGDTDSDNYIIDDTSTYRWYLKGASIALLFGDKEFEYQVLEGGISQVTRGYSLDYKAKITYTFTSSTHYQNWCKARAWWKANAAVITLIVKNDRAVNLAVYSTEAAPTTLVDWTGYLKNNLIPTRTPSSPTVNCEFILATDMV